MQTQYRQGDLLFVKTKSIPEGGKRRASGHILEGEVTGHIHRVADTQLAEAEVYVFPAQASGEGSGEKLFLSVSAEGGVSIVHEDHKTVELPPGNYEVVRQREYSPEAIRNVAD